MSARPEIIVDSFAGGGGTSEGIRQAIGRDPDIAINHNALALAMHRANHPGTHHMVEDVWSIDPLSMCDGRPIGLLWMSPDCKHFSKAKGGKPREKAIRGLAWVGLKWVKSLPKRQRPRMIILENVEEFQDWGPLDDDGKPCPIQKGKTFQAYLDGYRALGYVAEYRMLRACDYGDPTIRKRLFVKMRRDGKPIVWPARTHGNPKDAKDAALIATGTLKPWRTAAEIIDFTLPCPSIFDSAAEIKSKLGLRAIRPLADNTMARVAKGTMRYVVDAAKPFIVRLNHGDSGGRRHRSIDEPMPTVTHHGGEALVTPFVSYAQQGGANRPADEPIHTITASPKDQNVLVTPFVPKFNTGSVGSGIDEPVPTVTAHASETHGGGAAPLGLIAPILVGCGGRAGQSEPRPADEPVLTQTAKADACIVAPHLMTMRNAQKPFNGADEPAHTVTAGGAGLSLVSSFLVPRFGEREGQEPRTRPIDEPLTTLVPTQNEGSLAAVHLSRQFGASIGSDVEDPAPTVTAGGAGKSAVVAAFLAQHNTDMVGHTVEEPVSTIVGKGCTQGLIAAHMVTLRGSDRRDAEVDAPLNTLSAQGNHAGLVAAFLAKYYGNERDGVDICDPMHTVTTKDRVGLVTVNLQGQPYYISDIGMRMLTPRERFSAQGFRNDRCYFRITIWGDRPHQSNNSPALRAELHSFGRGRAGQNEAALAHVRIDCAQRRLEILSVEKSNGSASIAAPHSNDRLSTHLHDSAQIIARAVSSGEPVTETGKEAPLQSDGHSTRLRHGEPSASKSTFETTPPASDAFPGSSMAAGNITSITLPDTPLFRTAVSHWATLCSFAVDATRSFILGATENGSSSSILIEIDDAYIIDYGIREDGSRVVLTLEQQGGMCGNSVCPGMARALVAADFEPGEVMIEQAADMPLFPTLIAAE